MNDDKTAMNFWGRVEIAQKEAGIPTLKQLCESAGVYYNTVTNKRSLGRLPNLESAVEIAKEVGRPVEWLLLGEEKPKYDENITVANAINSDERLQEIAKKLLQADSDELKAIEVILKKYK